MIDIVIVRDDWSGPRQFVFPNRQLTIGTAPDCDVRLSDDSIGCVRIISMGDRLFRTSADAGWSGLRPLGPDDPLELGRYRVQLRIRAIDTATAPLRYTPRDDTEARLLAAVLSGAPGATAVYADWLDLHGAPAWAELLRVQDAADALGDDANLAELAAHASRLRALSAEIDLAWRILVTNVGVEACARFAFRCPMQWSLLEPTARAGVRHCAGCRKDVHYAISVGEARRHASAGHCVALDSLAPRWAEDLDAPFDRHHCPRCRADLGAHLERLTSCPECNHVPTANMMGRFVEPTLPAQQICV